MKKQQNSVMEDINVDSITAISLCAGGGGFDLGMSLVLENFRTVCYVEREAFAVEYLAKAMEEKILHSAPIWTDINTFQGRRWCGTVDCILAGYPCQPFSTAGHRRGHSDSRHLWPSISRIIREVKPWMLVLENVEGHLTLGLKEVLIDLDKLGYTTATGLFSAEETHATFEGTRLYVLALAKTMCERHERQIQFKSVPRLLRTGSKSFEMGSMVFPPHAKSSTWKSVCPSLYPSQSKIRLMADGMANASEEWITLYGNGICPIQAAYAFLSLWCGLRSDKM